MLLLLDMEKRLVCKLYEPPNLNPIKSDDDASTIISGAINLPDYFDDIPSYISCVDGWVNIAVFNFFKPKNYGFLFFSVATRASLTLPQLNVSTKPIYLGLSTAPDSPDCVFLALCLTNEFRRTIGIFRNGDTHWTTTQSVGGWFWKPKHITAVFIRGVFYFFFDVGIGSYDLATGLLKVDDYSAVLEFSEIHKFFGLDGDLMIAYYEKETLKFCIRKYDWSNKVWVPLQSLGGRSLYFTSCSVYVDQRNYYGISSANKIYVRVSINEETSRVDEYTLEDGQLTRCPSARWGSYTSFNVWVCPPDVLLRK